MSAIRVSAKALAPSLKLKAVLEVVQSGKQISFVCKKYGVCRQTLYLWIKEYKKDPKAAKAQFAPKYKRGKKHPKRLLWKVEKAVLDVVVREPELGLSTIVGRLKEQGIKVSLHGAYNVLLRHELQTKQLRKAFANEHPAKTVFAVLMPPKLRVKAVEAYKKDGEKIAKICKKWGISRPTFYKWLKNYEIATANKQEQLTEFELYSALARQYKRGDLHHRACDLQTKEMILSIVREDPALSVHKLYAKIAALGVSALKVGHHGIQNILSREGLGTLAARLIFAGGAFGQPAIEVVPLYRPEIPLYSWRQLIPILKNIPKLIVASPKAGASRVAILVVPFLISILWVRMLFGTANVSPVGLFFASVALFFGFFFLTFSMKYYLSIFMVLRLAQSGGITEGERI